MDTQNAPGVSGISFRYEVEPHDRDTVREIVAGTTVNACASVQGLEPKAFVACTCHVAGPRARAVVGVTLHVPVPLAQPASSAVYSWSIRGPPLSVTCRR